MVLVWSGVVCLSGVWYGVLSWLVFLAGIGFAGVCYLVSGISFCVGLCDCVLISDYSAIITLSKKLYKIKIRPY